MSGLLIPSFGQGFARCAAESANPHLWDGLVGAWWPFLGPTGGTLFDWSGYGNHGTLTNMAPATDWVAGEKGWVVATPGADDRVVVANASTLNPSLMSFGGWLRITGATASRRIASKPYTNPLAAPYYQYGFRTYGGSQLGCEINVGGVRKFIVGTALSVNIWYYIMLTYDGNTLRLFKDGKPDGTPVASSGTITSYATDLWFGDNTTGDAVAGEFSGWGLWNRALTPSKVQQLYVDPHALARPRSRIIFPAAAAGGAAPTSHLYGPLVGPLGGAI